MFVTQGLGLDGGMVTHGFGFGIGELLEEIINVIEVARLSLLEKVSNQLQQIMKVDLVPKDDLYTVVDFYQTPLDSLRERIESLEEAVLDLQRESDLPCNDT